MKKEKSEHLFIHDMSSRRRGVKAISKATVSEARYLLTQAKLSMVKVSKRLGMGLQLVKRIRNTADPNSNPLVDGRAKVPRFHKIHQRARELIDMLIDQAKTPLTLRSIQEQLVSLCHLRVSRPYLGQYMRVVANSSYRKIKPIMQIHNEMRCKLQRQLAASKYIQALHAGMTVINIDEAVIHFTDHRSRGWVRRGHLN